MARHPDEALTDQFYAWEKRGRGWQVFDSAVTLEPPFRPFLGHYLTVRGTPQDARRPSLFGGMLEALRGETSPPAADSNTSYDPVEEPQPEPFSSNGPLIELELRVPADLKVTRDRAGQLLTQLANGLGPVAFEAIGVPNAISLQFAYPEGDRGHAGDQIKAFFPEAVLRDRPGFLSAAWWGTGGTAAIVDFGMSREFMIPLRAGKDFDVDPLIPLVAALGDICADEFGLFQVLFESVRHPWAESAMRAVTDWDGRAFFADAPELVPLARAKVGHPLFAAVVRVASRARDEGRAWEIARNVGAALSQFADPAGNEFIPLANDGYPDGPHIVDMLHRRSRRSGMLLNAQELVSLVHLPSASVRSPKYRNASRKTAFEGIPDELRSRHVYIAGATQHGKSTFIERMALADIENGHGVCVLDPKGDLIKSIVHKIPERRVDDTILLEASNPVPIDFMGWETEQERQTLAADIFQTFLQFSTMTTGDQWLSVLRAVIYTLLDAKGCSFLDINTILVNDSKRREILARVTNPDILDYWNLEFPQLKKDAAQPIITRMKQFTFTPPLKTFLGTAHAKLNIFDCMETRRVILVDLTGVGKSNGNLVGQLLVSKIQQAAFRRESQPRSRRVPFHLYADEFQNFQTSAFDTILSEAGGYKLCLTLANQGLYQLEPKIKDAIFTNVTGGWVVFHIDEKDVPNFKLKTQPIDAEQLASLPPHTAFIKIGTEEPVILVTPPPVPPRNSNAEYIRKRTLDTYACKPAPVVDTSANGKPDPEATPAPRQNNGSSASGARDPFRTQEPRRRTDFAQKGANGKRRPDDKPEP
jgi:hypothetical protein